MPRLILLRHGQSQWNLENRFTGWVDVDLTAEGEAQARRGGEDHKSVAHDFPGRELLTPREIEVLGQITAGASNKEAGRHLGISPRTIEVHRARIMEKLGARNAADLVRIVLTGEHG